MMLLLSCLDSNERKAAEIIAGLVNARECRIIHAVSFETIEGVKQDAKTVVVVKIEGIAHYDSIARKDLVTSIAALRYFQWQDADLLEGYDRVEVDARGEVRSFKVSYSMDELSEAVSLEAVADHCLELVRKNGCIGLSKVLEIGQVSDSTHAEFSSGLQLMDSLYGAINDARVVGFRFAEDRVASKRILVFAIFIGGERNGGSYLELAVDPSSRQIIAINTFDPW